MTNLGRCFLDLAFQGSLAAAVHTPAPATYQPGSYVYVVDHYWPGWITNVDGAAVTVHTVDLTGRDGYITYDMDVTDERDQLRPCPDALGMAMATCIADSLSQRGA